MAQETCTQCGGALHVEQHSTYTALHCIAQPTHYSEHRRRPGASSLWGDAYNYTAKPEQAGLFEVVA
jgi:hypothetical protein